ncbi:hypothetical protein FO440_22605 [Mucilaginibacter corticis]|uniref:Uncharacterized protein n=1 Tax=Mucilaginibacter corticis TaxID=2597670 RepID=A0A556M9S9_9SPHI|nr:hypothetical protein [Mucilaginibacter corticis]TSJ36621.1 hypothetical protein FO440_22605 [Mucilaginibacter corticis]
MTQEQQVQEFLSKPFRSRNSLFEYNFYFTSDSRGLMEVVYLLREQVEFFGFEIDYHINIEPQMSIEDVETVLKNKESVSGINMVLSDAIYYLTHDIESIWKIETSFPFAMQ